MFWVYNKERTSGCIKWYCSSIQVVIYSHTYISLVQTQYILKFTFNSLIHIILCRPIIYFALHFVCQSTFSYT